MSAPGTYGYMVDDLSTNSNTSFGAAMSRLSPLCQGLAQIRPGIRQEALDAHVRKGVAHHRLQDSVRDGGYGSARLGRLDHVAGMAEAGGEHLGRQVISVEDLHGLPYHLHAVLASVIEAADEGADVGGAGGRGQERLVRGEDQRH